MSPPSEHRAISFWNKSGSNFEPFIGMFFCKIHLIMRNDIVLVFWICRSRRLWQTKTPLISSDRCVSCVFFSSFTSIVWKCKRKGKYSCDLFLFISYYGRSHFMKEAMLLSHSHPWAVVFKNKFLKLKSMGAQLRAKLSGNQVKPLAWLWIFKGSWVMGLPIKGSFVENCTPCSLLMNFSFAWKELD